MCNLSIQCHLDLLYKIVQPILLYGCKVWEFSNFAAAERIHLKFCKLLLNLKQSTPDFMVYGHGELGRYPMEIQINTRMLTYWSKLIIMEKTKNMQNYFMIWVLNYSKKIEETLVGLKILKVF